jgi:DNA gyrase inhibitor GyrI
VEEPQIAEEKVEVPQMAKVRVVELQMAGEKVRWLRKGWRSLIRWPKKE